MGHKIPKTVLSAQNLTVTRGQRTLRVPTLRVAAGEVMCIIGQRGCGKSTLLRVLAGRARVQSGEVVIDGTSADSGRHPDRTVLGFVGNDNRYALLQRRMVLRQLHSTMRKRGDNDTGRQAQSIATTLHFARPRHWFLPLAAAAKTKIRLIYALMYKPKIVLLDEPLNGLGRQATRDVQELVRDEADRGTALVVATQDLQWAARAADHITLLVSGNLVVSGSKRTLIAKYGSLENMQARLT